MFTNPIKEFEGEDRISLDSEKNVLGSKVVESGRHGLQLGPIRVDQMTVRDGDIILVLADWIRE